MASSRIVSIDLTHLVEAALRGEHDGQGGGVQEDDELQSSGPDPRVAGIR